LFTRGQNDASNYYKKYKAASTATLVTTIVLSPLLGLVPAAACSSTPPEFKNLGTPDSKLMENPNYYNGYMDRAKTIKSRSVWTNWGIGFAVNLFVILAFIS